MDGEVTGVLDGTGAELEGGLLGDLGGGERNRRTPRRRA